MTSMMRMGRNASNELASKFKTVAPKTAAAIRAAVNSDPRLMKTIQFNTIGGFSALPFLNQQPSEQ